jgi:DNA-binding XRE family transcriptional regulator
MVVARIEPSLTPDSMRELFCPPYGFSSQRPDMTPVEIRAARHALGLMRHELAAQLGVTELSIWRWEKGLRTITAAHQHLLKLLLREHAVGKERTATGGPEAIGEK